MPTINADMFGLLNQPMPCNGTFVLKFCRRVLVKLSAPARVIGNTCPITTAIKISSHPCTSLSTIIKAPDVMVIA